MKPNVRYLVLGVLLGLVWLTQLIPALATFYSQTVYPCFSYILSSFSNLFPFAIGDLFIFPALPESLFIRSTPACARRHLGKRFCCATANTCCGCMYGSIFLGIELFSKELLPTDRNSVYRLHTREFSEVRERIYYPTEPFVHSHKQY